MRKGWSKLLAITFGSMASSNKKLRGTGSADVSRKPLSEYEVQNPYEASLLNRRQWQDRWLLEMLSRKDWMPP